MIRVVFVSDQPISALGLRTLLSNQAGLGLVGEFSSGNDVVHLVKKLKPDILIIDCYLLENPSEFIVRQIHDANLGINFIALSQIIDEQHFRSLVDEGVKGYLLTSEPLNAMIEAIFDVAVGKFRVSAALERFLTDSRSSPQEHWWKLTPREREILALIAGGYSNTQIAESLSISVGTVKNHSKNIFKKLNVHTRVEAVLFGLKHGLVEIKKMV